jgi:hypothetical protein
MSCNCIIKLPNDTRISDLLKVLGILNGLESHKENFQSGNGYSCRVDKVSYGYAQNEHKKEYLVYSEPTFEPEFFIIRLSNEITLDGEWHELHCLLSAENITKGYIHLSGGANEYWKKIGTALIKFFGGTIDYNDCDSKSINKRYDKPRKSNCPNDGKAWDNFEDELLALKPLEKFKGEQYE